METIDFSRYGLMPAAQGWQCPICKRIYSPTTIMCLYCGGGTKATTNTDLEHHTTSNVDQIMKGTYKDGADDEQTETLSVLRR